MSTFESAALSSNCPIKLRRIRVRFQFFKVVANAATTQAGAAVTSAGAHVTTPNTGKAAQASTAGVNQATAKHLGAQTAGLQQDQDTITALGTPADKRTEAQNILVAAAEAKLAAKNNTPEKLSAARKSAETYTEKIMRAGKWAMDSFSPGEMANMRATMMASGELAALAQASGGFSASGYWGWGGGSGWGEYQLFAFVSVGE